MNNIITLTEQENKMEALINENNNLVKHSVICSKGIRVNDIVLFQNGTEIITDNSLMNFMIKENNENQLYNLSVINVLGKGIITLKYSNIEEALEKYNDFCERALKDIPDSELIIIK